MLLLAAEDVVDAVVDAVVEAIKVAVVRSLTVDRSALVPQPTMMLIGFSGKALWLYDVNVNESYLTGVR
jgi:hypothetical protein